MKMFNQSWTWAKLNIGQKKDKTKTLLNHLQKCLKISTRQKFEKNISLLLMQIWLSNLLKLNCNKKKTLQKL